MSVTWPWSMLIF